MVLARAAHPDSLRVRPAAGAALRDVLQALLGEEALLAAREDEAVAAVATGERPVFVHRDRPPTEGRASRSAPRFGTIGGENTGRVKPVAGAIRAARRARAVLSALPGIAPRTAPSGTIRGARVVSGAMTDTIAPLPRARRALDPHAARRRRAPPRARGRLLARSGAHRRRRRPGSSGAPHLDARRRPRPPSPTASPPDRRHGRRPARGDGRRLRRRSSSSPRHAPSFTLYGDGTVVFRDSTAVAARGGRQRHPLGRRSRPRARRGRHPGAAREAHRAGRPRRRGRAVHGTCGADIPIDDVHDQRRRARRSRSASSGFLPEMHPQDRLIVAALGAPRRAARRLRRATSPASSRTCPTAYRGVLMQGRPGVRRRSSTGRGPRIAPADFVAGDNEFFMTGTLTLAEVAGARHPRRRRRHQRRRRSRDGERRSTRSRSARSSRTRPK